VKIEDIFISELWIKLKNSKLANDE
jgi:hypothetical protein